MKKIILVLMTVLAGFMSIAQVSDADAKQALQLVSSSKASLGLSADDLNHVLVTTTYFDKSTGLTMVYLQQTYAGIPVLKQIMPLAFKGNKLVSKAGVFEHSMDQIVNVKSGIPAISATSAVQYAITDRKLTASKMAVVIGTKENGRKIEYNDMGVSGQNITAELLWVPVEESIKKENTVSTKISMRLSWQVFIAPTTSSDYWMVCIDAIDNKTIRVDNLTIYDNWGHPNESETGGSAIVNNNKAQTINSATDLFGTKNLLKLNEQIPNSPSLVNNSTYRVIPFPAESPLISPPAVVSNPWTAAPGNATTLGWHTGAGGINYDYTKGNNAWAYADRDGINGGSLAETVFSTTTPDPLTFNFVPDFSVDPLQSAPVPNKQFNVTNLFYWTNVIHDVMYQYGFDEPAHNFQDDNLGRGGIGNDYVFAEAQDGSGTNNANFSTPNDGTSGRMQMYLWNLNSVSPNRDGDVDNGIVVHEYGHGISTRLTGGGANVCLTGAEHMGEGWSDYFHLMFTTNWATATASDGFNIPRHLGNYALNNISIFTCPYAAPVPPCTAAPNIGIRHFPYSTNMAVNPWVYATVIPSAVHDRGELWAATLWDMTWNIIAQEGINANLYNAAGGGGNNIALRLVTLGLKLQPCSVGFIAGRDAILAADQALYAGAHRCAIMNAFARRGMGLNASQGLSSSVTDQVPDFTGYQPEVLLTQNGTVSVFEGQNIVYYNRVTNSNCEAISNYTLRDTLPLNVTFVSATNGGTYNAGTRVVSWPVNLAVSAVADYAFTVNINLGSYFPPAPPLIAAVNMRSSIFNNVDSRLSLSDTITIIGSINTVINAAPPVVITAENAVPANNAPDPGETLTVNLPLINIGATNTTNLVATLLATGGVSAPSGPQTYGVVVSLAPSIAMPYTFTASGNCGDNIILTLALQDGATNLGTITYTLPLGVEQGSTQTFANTTAIIIPATGTGAATGSPANPYPSNINVSGMIGQITNVKVGLKQFNHTYPGDIDVLLVSPTGQKMILMSDAASGFFITTNVNINLDDAATILLPSGTAISSGIYRPTDYTAGDAFPAPAPASPYLSPATIGTATLASAFGGQNPNGTWSLYVVDDLGGDVGNFNGGWDITITTTFNVCNAVPAPTVINPVITTGTVGAVFSQTFTASGGTAPYTFTTASTLPTGLSLSSAGVLSGIPTQIGTFPIVVTVTDNNASTGTGSTYTLVISCITNPIVINNNNSGPGSLRQAVIDACPGSTITFDMNTVTSPISLSGGLIRIDKNLTIQGPGTNPLTVQNTAPKNYSSRVFHVVYGVTANISGFTISGANTYGSGGGIYNEGVLNIMNATISNNLADSAGAGIYNLGSLTVTNSTISNNLTNSLGYTGIGAYGGGICSVGYYGGGTVNVTNSTISNNSANFGGGIYSSSTINFRNSIIAGNTSRYASSPDLNVYGTLTSQGYNLVGKRDGSSGWVATDLTGTIATPLNPLLGPLADNGGPTQTLALLAGSPAINAGSNALAVDPGNNPLLFDQRGTGFPRIVNSTVDIGAFEVECIPPTINAPTLTQPTCTTATGTIVVNATGSGILEYSIDNGASWQISATFSGLAPGNYNIKVHLQASPACESTYGNNPVVIHATEIPVVGIAADGPIIFCAGGSVNLSAVVAYPNFLRVLTPYAINMSIGTSPTFGSPITTIPVNGDFVYIPDGTASYLGCSPYAAGSLNGKVALIDRGICLFTIKVKNAQDAGATAVIIVNNIAGGPINMGGVDPTITIPTISVSQSDGAILKNLIAQGTTNGNTLAHSYSYFWSNGATTASIPVTQSGTFTVQATDENGCSGTSEPVTVTVNPIPNAVATASSQTICSGSPITTIALTGNVSGTVYNWTRDNTATVTGIAAGGAGDISGTLTNTTNAPVTVTFTITPTANDCTGTPVIATVTVNPVPNVNSVGSQTYCAGASVPSVVFSSNVPGAVYSWSRTNEAIGLGSNSGTGNVPSFTATNVGTTPLTTTFSVVASYTNNGVTCNGTPIQFTITVNPVANVNSVSNQGYCIGASVPSVVFNSNVPGAIYSWSRTNEAIGLGSNSGTGNIPAFTATNTGTTLLTSTFSVVASYTNNGVTCTGTPIQFTITVKPAPDAIATPSSQAVCSKQNITAIVLSGNVPGTTFDWTRDNAVVTGIASSGSGDISGALTNNSTVPVTVTFTITPKANGCYGSPVTATVTVNPLTVISVNPVSQTIFALNNTSFSVTATGTAPVSYQWQVSINAGATYSNLADGGVYSGTGTNTLSLTAVPYTMSGYKYQCVVTGGCSEATSTAATLTINRRPTVITYTGDNTEQYSDQQTLTATLKDQLTNAPLSGKTVTFTIGIQSVSDGPAAPGNGTDATGIASALLKLYQNPGSYTVASAFAGDATYLPAPDSDPFTITKENAIADYTGPEFINVPCATCATTTILLSASIRDTTAVYPLNDIYPGDIRKARVKFINLNTLADISGWLTPGLVNVADTTKGIVSYSWVVPIPASGYDVYSIAVIVDGPSATVGNYIGKTETVVNVSRNTLTEFITGGGNIVPSASNGQYASDAGKKVNFGFNVKYNRNGTNLQGSMNIIFRRGTRVYQIKATSMTSLSINSANPCSRKAIFTSKANLTDVTNPAAASSIYGGITLKVTMTDNGDPGNTDMIGMTLMNGNNLVYSSNWVSTQTNELVLNGGNLIVHNGVVCPNAFVNNTNQTTQRAVATGDLTDELNVTVYPNPSSTDFAIQVNSQSSEPILINVMDVSGRILESFTAITKGTAIKVGSNLRSGTYFAEVTQGTKRKVVKLIKGN